MEREKKYVPVLVRFDAEGKMRPVEIEFEEGQVFAVDRILDVRRAACQSVGGVGDRYTCRIMGKETYLWFEKGRWFVAAKRYRQKNSSAQISNRYLGAAIVCRKSLAALCGSGQRSIKENLL